MIVAKDVCQEENFGQLSGFEILFTKMAVCADRPRATMEVCSGSRSPREG